MGMPFIIKTDQQSLKFILEQWIVTLAQQKWFTKLLGYSFVVEYKKGKENKVADALSRLLDTDFAQPVSGVDQSLESVAAQPEHENLFLISFPCPTWLAMLKDSYKTDEEYQQLISALTSGTSGPASFTLQNGIFLYKEKVF